MLARAPLDLRTNRLAGTRDDLAALFPEGQAIAGAPDGWRLPPEPAAVQNPAYAEGRFEVQDDPSQYASSALDAAPDMPLVNLFPCGGGKQPPLANLHARRPHIPARDPTQAPLEQ